MKSVCVGVLSIIQLYKIMWAVSKASVVSKVAASVGWPVWAS